MKDLTPAQARMLEEVRTAGSKAYNGRARRTIQELERRGLVEVDWDMDLIPKGGGTATLWRITVTPREEED